MDYNNDDNDEDDDGMNIIILNCYSLKDECQATTPAEYDEECKDADKRTTLQEETSPTCEVPAEVDVKLEKETILQNNVTKKIKNEEIPLNVETENNSNSKLSFSCPFCAKIFKLRVLVNYHVQSQHKKCFSNNLQPNTKSVVKQKITKTETPLPKANDKAAISPRSQRKKSKSTKCSCCIAGDHVKNKKLRKKVKRLGRPPKKILVVTPLNNVPVESNIKDFVLPTQSTVSTSLVGKYKSNLPGTAIDVSKKKFSMANGKGTETETTTSDVATKGIYSFAEVNGKDAKADLKHNVNGNTCILFDKPAEEIYILKETHHNLSLSSVTNSNPPNAVELNAKTCATNKEKFKRKRGRPKKRIYGMHKVLASKGNPVGANYLLGAKLGGLKDGFGGGGKRKRTVALCSALFDKKAATEVLSPTDPNLSNDLNESLSRSQRKKKRCSCCDNDNVHNQKKELRKKVEQRSDNNIQVVVVEKRGKFGRNRGRPRKNKFSPSTADDTTTLLTTLAGKIAEIEPLNQSNTMSLDLPLEEQDTQTDVMTVQEDRSLMYDEIFKAILLEARATTPSMETDVENVGSLLLKSPSTTSTASATEVISDFNYIAKSSSSTQDSTSETETIETAEAHVSESARVILENNNTVQRKKGRGWPKGKPRKSAEIHHNNSPTVINETPIKPKGRIGCPKGKPRRSTEAQHNISTTPTAEKRKGKIGWPKGKPRGPRPGTLSMPALTPFNMDPVLDVAPTNKMESSDEPPLLTRTPGRRGRGRPSKFADYEMPSLRKSTKLKSPKQSPIVIEHTTPSIPDPAESRNTKNTKIRSYKRYQQDWSIESSNSPLKCPHCPNLYKHKFTLNAHLKHHTGEYSCHTCSKKFVSNSALIVHLRHHTQERPYSCPHCSAKCSQKGNLMRHIAKKHPKPSLKQKSFISSVRKGMKQQQKKKKNFLGLDFLGLGNNKSLYTTI